MQINAVNSLITRTPSFSSNYDGNQGDYYDDVNRLAAALGYDPNNTVGADVVEIVSDSEADKSKKSLQESAIALAGAVLIPFVTGKAIVLGANKIFPNIVSGVTKQGSEISSKLGKNMTRLISNEKLTEPTRKYLKGIQDKAGWFVDKVSKSGKPEQTLANVVGIAAAACNAPKVISEDSNSDGIQDILQKQVGVYGTVEKGLSAARTILEIVG